MIESKEIILRKLRITKALSQFLITHPERAMPKQIPIKTDLFRFVSLRSPGPLSEATKNIRFVTHPAIKKSLIQSCPSPGIRRGEKEKVPFSVFEEYLKRFKAFQNKAEVRKFSPKLFDYASQVIKQKIRIKDLGTKGIKDLTLSGEELVKLYDQIFYQVATKESHHIRQCITQMMIIDHAIKNARLLIAIDINKITDISVEIPQEVIECLKPWIYPDCSGNTRGLQNLGIADFRRVEQEVCCYIPGEVSHIENIMAKEYKERSTRNYVRTENTFETFKETEVESLTDVTTITRNELSSEIASVLEEERTNKYGASLGVKAKIWGADVDIKTYADFSNSNSSSNSNTEAKTYAEEVTRRALEKIVQKTSEKRTSKITKEFEENNKHGFDNRSGGAHVTGIYRWLDILYTNRLVNYGKRLMIEFMVPKPADFYKRILKYTPPESTNPDDEVNEENDTPTSLEAMGINSHTDITRENYLVVAEEYGIAVNAPLPETKSVSQAFSPIPPIGKRFSSWTHPFTITIEPDYQAETVGGNYSFRWKSRTGTKARFSYAIGSVTGGRSNLRGGKTTTTGTISGNLNPVVTQSLPLRFAGFKLYTYGVTVNVTCKLIPAKFEEWQLDTYNKLLTAYEAALAQSEDDQANDEVEQTGEATFVNPAMHRIIEQRELKRICMEMIMKPFCLKQGADFTTEIDACGLYNIPQVDQTEGFTAYVSQVKFFEQAIDWDLMSYLFYGYQWADICEWAELMQSESDDLTFQAFLQSGMARVVIPVRQQFIKSVSYYLETGEIWLGEDLVPGTDDDLYLSIAEEMQTIEGVVEEEWETRVPTALAIIQGKSAYLDQEGLPCCDDAENDDTTTSITGTDQILQIVTDDGEP